MKRQSRLGYKPVPRVSGHLVPNLITAALAVGMGWLLSAPLTYTVQEVACGPHALQFTCDNARP
jgi:hypothetical protein